MGNFLSGKRREWNGRPYFVPGPRPGSYKLYYNAAAARVQPPGGQKPRSAVQAMQKAARLTKRQGRDMLETAKRQCPDGQLYRKKKHKRRSIMKRKQVGALALCLCLCLTACGGPAASGSAAASSAVSSTSTASSAASLPDSALEALGDIETEEELFDVTITVPADLVQGKTQEELDQEAAEEGMLSATLNEDGSVTYVMTHAQHAEMLDQLRISIQTALDELVTSGDYENITAIQGNEDFTAFTVTTRSEEPLLEETAVVFGCYMYGGLYGIFSGETPENIHVDFVNADPGAVIGTFDSSDAEE